ncbi:hypothetical protein, partial [Sphingomonas sp. Leaf30]|jgi:hypothetical protein|uniref:hypothetical protein n=1 Tax=Sphingomonas sp. Leaf30 TaxID=1736213 RepID=UPI001F294629
MRLLVLASYMVCSTIAPATSPAQWIMERSECLTIQTDHVRVGAANSLSMQTARTLAKRITLACRSTIPSELFTAQERADMEGADRFDIIRELMSKPPSDVR